MPILPPWAGEGSLPSAEVLSVAGLEREGWAALRSLQGDPSVDVLRWTLSGGDPARGVPRDRTPVSGLDGIPALVGDLTLEQAERFGVELEAGLRTFELFTDVDVRLTDLLRHPSGTGDVYAVLRRYYDEHIGQTILVARPAPGAA
jgi:hypothetical protein